MITLDEAIKHCEEVAEENEEIYEAHCRIYSKEVVEKYPSPPCKKCADEHKQLAEWLTELKQFKEQEPCEDTVNRQSVLDINFKQIMLTTANPAEMIRQKVKALPPATPIRKVGEWIKKNNDYFDWYECSECGYGSDGEMKYNRLCDVRTKFCPDCGSQNLKEE